MPNLRLLYFDGSPFARIVRVLAHEWDIPLETTELTDFPFDDAIFDETPFGQVPLLYEDGHAIFPTALIIRRLAQITRRPYDAQRLAVALQMGDALVAAKYQDWSGLTQTGEDRLGFNPGHRNLTRVLNTLDWFDAQIPTAEVTVEGVSVAAFLLWAESRDPIDWQGRNGIEALVDFYKNRPSFTATQPKPWPGAAT